VHKLLFLHTLHPQRCRLPQLLLLRLLLLRRVAWAAIHGRASAPVVLSALLAVGSRSRATQA
jgi:hypothetical protein